jgi:nucleoside-diphosphate-sugar epimerase
MGSYLVTGGAGFIGSHVVERLLRNGERVRVIDNFSTGRRDNLLSMAGDIELFEGDIRSYERVHNATLGVDRVIHLAALPSVPRSVQDPLTTNESNVTGTLNVLLCARDVGVAKVVLASSSSVYGANQQLPKHEGLVPQPISPYGVSKLAAEQYALAFADVYGMPTTALRYFNVYGPRQDPHSQYTGVVARWLQAARDGAGLVIFGDGHQTRDFTYVDDVVAATLAAAAPEAAVGVACNVAGGARHELLDLVAAVEAAADRKLAVTFADPRPGDVLHSFGDISRAAELLGYAPSTQLREGVLRTFLSLQS